MKTLRGRNSTARIELKPLANFDEQIAQKVERWISNGVSIKWIPIITSNSAVIGHTGLIDVLMQSEANTEVNTDAIKSNCYLPIRKPGDFLKLPEHVPGWLLPLGQTDTDVVCEKKSGEIYFFGVTHKVTGQKQTLLGEGSTSAPELVS
jgi:hypothetical protein